MKKVIISYTNTYLSKTVSDFAIVDICLENISEIASKLHDFSQDEVTLKEIKQELHNILSGVPLGVVMPDHHIIRAKRAKARKDKNTDFDLRSFRIIPFDSFDYGVNFHCLVDNHVFSHVKNRNDLEPIDYVFGSTNDSICIGTASGIYKVTGYEIQKLERSITPLSTTSYETFINGNNFARLYDCRFLFIDKATFQFSEEFKKSNPTLAPDIIEATYFISSANDYISLTKSPVLELVNVDKSIPRKNIITTRADVVANMIRVY